MKVERLVLKSKNFVYVFHTNEDVRYMRFMGMTEQAYQSAKGTYKVLCFPQMDNSREKMIADVEYEFSLDKDVRNISSKSKEESIACVNEFVNEIKPMIEGKGFCHNQYSVLFEKGNFEKGIIFEGLIEKWRQEGYGLNKPLNLTNARGVKMLGTVKNTSSLLLSEIPTKCSRREVVTPISMLKYMYNAKLDNGAILTIQSSDDGTECVYSLGGCYLSDATIKLIKELNKHEEDYVISDYNRAYYV